MHTVSSIAVLAVLLAASVAPATGADGTACRHHGTGDRRGHAEGLQRFAVGAKERGQLAREAVNVVATVRDTAQQLFDAGEVPQVDLLCADFELRRATNRLTLAEASAGTAARSLALLIGAAPSATLNATDSLLLDFVTKTLDELVPAARANRPDVKTAEGAVEAANASLRLVEAERFVPSLTFSASYGEAAEFDATNRRVLFGVSVPLPLWNRREGSVHGVIGEVRKQEAPRGRG
jgi:cobalt-zinc-cadmium efflux system outer membrane protein